MKFSKVNETEIDMYNGRPAPALVAIGLCLFVIIFFTVIGNILVISAPAVNRKLRNVTGMFIVSLATADLLLGVIVLPFSAIFEIRRYWDFGPVLCNIYVAFDVMFCTASILNLFAISLDRYVAITDPMTYQQKMTKSRALIIIAIFWIVALLISFLPVHLGWNTDDGNVQNYDDLTNCGLKSNPWYSLIDGILLFFLPLTVMGCLYFRILLIARKQARTINAQSVRITNQHHSTSNGGSPDTNHTKHSTAVDEHKTTKMLATIMSCFIVCWVPYFSMFTFIPLFNANVPMPLYMVALWLGYTNSTLNPLLYAALNGEFRKAFRKLLFRSKRSALRSETMATGIELASHHNPSPRNSKIMRNSIQPDTNKTKYGIVDTNDDMACSSHTKKSKGERGSKVKH
ncbi:LOW QUALITY PROTEIN: histamine H2 receptor-like [Amphiura filiformis]|uniref:LOW QUALITY PROTEIN: histamine H2 receptor-like n=1 Tax=Amphiura filiformis TaxID=82378 RepID=UPI003B222E41